MDTWEASKIVFERVRALDPENASKMVGMLLVQEHSHKEMIRLAFGPDDLLRSFVARAYADLAAKPSSPSSPVLGPWGMPPSPGREHAPFPDGEQMGCDGGEALLFPDDYDCWSPPAAGEHHSRSFSLSDAEVAASRPCHYFARGFCKNGASCRFLHSLSECDAAAEREMSELVQRAKAMAARPPRMEPAAFPFSPPPRGLDFLLQQHELQRSVAMLQEDMSSRFVVRSPHMAMDRMDLMMNSPAARQIYLTFPADSTFTEEDVSNYFSTYGPVQDVRIPYQQKRMFGFVTFVYPETVKIILSKGNPHFVCDARVLVKPYKEKGKVPNRFRKLPSPLPGEYPRCMSMTPTGLLDPTDPFDLQQPQIGPRMMLGDIAIREAFLRRKLEERQQATELQQAMELQNRRFMGLQLLDLKNRGHHLGSPVGSPDGKGSVNGNDNAIHLEDVVTIQASHNKRNSSSFAMSAPVSSGFFDIAALGKREEQKKEEDGDGTSKHAVNPGEEQKRESGPVTLTAAPNVAWEFQESGVDHNLPESLLASPTRAKASIGVTAQNGSISPHHVAASLFPPTSSLDMPPYNSCFFQVPRFTSGHEAIGL